MSQEKQKRSDEKPKRAKNQRTQYVNYSTRDPVSYTIGAMLPAIAIATFAGFFLPAFGLLLEFIPSLSGVLALIFAIFGLIALYRLITRFFKETAKPLPEHRSLTDAILSLLLPYMLCYIPILSFVAPYFFLAQFFPREIALMLTTAFFVLWLLLVFCIGYLIIRLIYRKIKPKEKHSTLPDSLN